MSTMRAHPHRARHQIRLHPPQPRFAREEKLARIEKQRPVAPSLRRQQEGVDALGQPLAFRWLSAMSRLPQSHCNAPFFPDINGEMQHPELPDEIDLDPVQLH